jgi:hypothetical protein
MIVSLQWLFGVRGVAHNLRYAGSVQRNLTLTIDEEVLRAARKLALDRNTSVNQMVREYLAGLISETARWQAAAERFRELSKNSKAEVGPITWTRDDLHDRKQW